MVEAVAGEPPWGKALDDAAVKYHVTHGKKPLRPSAMLDEEWALIERMTCLEPANRVTMDFVVTHLYAKVVGLSMGRLYREHSVSADDNQVVAQPQALLALSSLATSSNRSIATSASNLVSMVQYCRWFWPAQRQEVDGVVALFQDERGHVMEWAATAVGHLACRSEANRAMIRDAGGISQVVRLLKASGSSSKQAAAALYALEGLAVDGDNIAAIVQAGAIAPLCELLQRGRKYTDGERRGLRESAADVLANLLAVESRRRKIACVGIVPSLMAMLRDGTDGGKEKAAVSLMNMTTATRSSMLARSRRSWACSRARTLRFDKVHQAF